MRDDEGRELADAIDRRGVAAILAAYRSPGRPATSRRSSRASSALIGFSNSMFTASEWPTNTGTRTQVAVSLIVGVEDLLGLDLHLPLFRGVAVIHEVADVRNHVEGDLLR